MINSTPGTDQHEHKRHKHHGLVLGAVVVGGVIVLAGLLLLHGGGGGRAETRPAVVAPATPVTSSDAGSLAFRRSGTPEPGKTGPSSNSVSPTPTPRPAATPTPKAAPSSQSQDQDPGDLGLVDDLSSYKFTVHKEFTGAIAQTKLAHYQDIFEGWEGLFPDTPPTTDRPFIIDSSGVYVAPTQYNVVTKFGAKGSLTDWIVGKRWQTQFNKQPITEQTLDQPFNPSDFLETIAIWDNGIVGYWWDGDPSILMHCHPAGEKINGVSTRECNPYKLSDEQAFDLIDGFGGSTFQHYDTFSLQVWLMANDKYPVRLRLSVVGEDGNGDPERLSVAMDLSNINDKTLKVTLPK